MVKQVEVHKQVNYYTTYFKKKRSERQIYIMVNAITRVCENWFPHQTPSLYVMYLAADASLSIINKSKSELAMIAELEEELIKDYTTFNQLV